MAVKLQCVLLVPVILTAAWSCGIRASDTKPVAPGPSSTSPYWLLEDFDIAPLLAAGWSTVALQSHLDNAHTLLIIQRGHEKQDALLPRATRVASWSSFAGMQRALAAGTVPEGTKYLLYDNERWAATPLAEQKQPFVYALKAEQLAHRHGYKLIFTPAANLATVADPSYRGLSKYQGYLNLRFAERGAAVSDVLEIQSQQDEGPGFDEFVTSAVEQARAGHRKGLVLVGLTTHLPHRQVTRDLLLQAYRSTRFEVSGYWINLPREAGSSPVGGGLAVGLLSSPPPPSAPASD